MADPEHEPPPEHSLPSYFEPTPETHRRISREEEAEIALKGTQLSQGAARILIALFLLTILAQILAGPKLSSLRTLAPNRAAWLPHPPELKSAEKEIERESGLSRWLQPRTQYLLTRWGGAGNEQAYLGAAGWLYYRPDVDYLTGPPFLQARPDSVAAVLDFHRQLAARGVTLVVFPVPSKASIMAGAPVENASLAPWISRLRAAGVQVFTPPTGAYLETDTHWRPETMEQAARALAAEAAPWLGTPASRPAYRSVPVTVENLGDIATMLRLPADQRLFAPQTVTVHQVQLANNLWRPSPEAEVLLLGDSFANIYSLHAMGWGESAGFPEQLSFALGRPLDCLLRNSDGAFATRELLSRELARGNDRLAGKKLVIWEFAQRELAFGDWKILPLAVGTPRPSALYAPRAGEHPVVTGTVKAISAVPRPSTVPYRDHLLTVQLTEVSGPAQPGEKFEVLVTLWSMRAQVWTSAARLRPGDRVTVRLTPWGEVAEQLEKINRSELDDPALQLEVPAWGELLD